MKLKIVSSLIVLSFIVTLFSVQGNAFAAMLDSKVVYLGKSVKTASTKRINVYPGQYKLMWSQVSMVAKGKYHGLFLGMVKNTKVV
jgi:hypothetical protein